MNSETILIFNLSDKTENIKKLSEKISDKIKVIAVNKCDFFSPIESLVLMKKSAPCFFETFDDPMIIFANFSDNHLDEILKSLSLNGIKVPLKAVMNETNKEWSAMYLYKNLLAEHREIMKMKNKIN